MGRKDAKKDAKSQRFKIQKDAESQSP